MTEMLRFNEGKRRVSIFPPVVHQLFLAKRASAPVFIDQVTQVLEFGAAKYDLHNWKKSGSWHKCADSAVRHILKFVGNEEIDPESNLPHLAHYGCNLVFLFEFAVYGTGTDDRWKGYETPRMVQMEGVENDPILSSFQAFLAWLDGGDTQFLEVAIFSLAAYMEQSAK